MGQGHLFSLPIEVVHQIADDLDPDGLGSFALTNKTAYCLSRRAIKRHQNFIKKYSTLYFGDTGNLHHHAYTRPGDHVLFFLEKVLFNHRIAHYPKSIYAAKWDYDSDDAAIKEIGDLASVIAKYGPELAAFGTEHRGLKEQVRREAWRDALQIPTNQYHHLAMLLSILPNLQTITLASMSDVSEPLREVVWATAAANRDPQNTNYKRALGKLTKIKILNSATEIGEGMNLYNCLTALPSTRLAHIIGGDISQRELRPQNYDRGPADLQPRQIDEIKFENTAIHFEVLDIMLQNIGDLKRFTQSDASYNSDSMPPIPFFLGGIVALLRKYAGHSLVSLYLTAGYGSFESSEPDPTSKYIQDQFVGDLKGFQKLRFLSLNDTAFRKPDHGKIVQLVDVLPASIWMVRLVRQIGRHSSIPAELFIGLPEGKKDLLPHLKYIVLQGYSDNPRTFNELFSVDINIAVKF